jgi:adenylate cyclase
VTAEPPVTPVSPAQQLLRSAGHSDEEIAAADEGGWLFALVQEAMLGLGVGRFTEDEIAARAGVDVEIARRLWRAMGFASIPPDRKVFTDLDVQALVSAARQAGMGDPAALDQLVRQTRSISASLARVAETASDEMIDALRRMRESGLTDLEIADRVLPAFDLETSDRLILYLYHRQLRAAVWRKVASAAAAEETSTVGFVDLVGFTELAQQLDEDDLSGMVGRFEALAYDTIAEHGGRVVKMIGDEVMFATPFAAPAARIALTLTAAAADDELLPEARAGLACGPTISRDGDLFGPPVNLASRAVDRARPGTVLVSEPFRDELDGDTAFDFSKPMGRRLKGLGVTILYRLKAAG